MPALSRNPIHPHVPQHGRAGVTMFDADLTGAKVPRREKGSKASDAPNSSLELTLLSAASFGCLYSSTTPLKAVKHLSLRSVWRKTKRRPYRGMAKSIHCGLGIQPSDPSVTGIQTEGLGTRDIFRTSYTQLTQLPYVTIPTALAWVSSRQQSLKSKVQDEVCY